MKLSKFRLLYWKLKLPFYKYWYLVRVPPTDDYIDYFGDFEGYIADWIKTKFRIIQGFLKFDLYDKPKEAVFFPAYYIFLSTYIMNDLLVLERVYDIKSLLGFLIRKKTPIIKQSSDNPIKILPYTDSLNEGETKINPYWKALNINGLIQNKIIIDNLTEQKFPFNFMIRTKIKKIITINNKIIITRKELYGKTHSIYSMFFAWFSKPKKSIYAKHHIFNYLQKFSLLKEKGTFYTLPYLHSLDFNNKLSITFKIGYCYHKPIFVEYTLFDLKFLQMKNTIILKFLSKHFNSEKFYNELNIIMLGFKNLFEKTLLQIIIVKFKIKNFSYINTLKRFLLKHIRKISYFLQHYTFYRIVYSFEYAIFTIIARTINKIYSYEINLEKFKQVNIISYYKRTLYSISQNFIYYFIIIKFIIKNLQVKEFFLYYYNMFFKSLHQFYFNRYIDLLMVSGACLDLVYLISLENDNINYNLFLVLFVTSILAIYIISIILICIKESSPKRLIPFLLIIIFLDIFYLQIIWNEDANYGIFIGYLSALIILFIFSKKILRTQLFYYTDLWIGLVLWINYFFYSLKRFHGTLITNKNYFRPKHYMNNWLDKLYPIENFPESQLILEISCPYPNYMTTYTVDIINTSQTLTILFLIIMLITVYFLTKEKSLLATHDYTLMTGAVKTPYYKNIYDELFFVQDEQHFIYKHLLWLKNTVNESLIGGRSLNTEFLRQKYFEIDTEYDIEKVMSEFDPIIYKNDYYQHIDKEIRIQDLLKKHYNIEEELIFKEDPDFWFKPKTINVTIPWEDHDEAYENFISELYDDYTDFIQYTIENDRRKITILKKTKTRFDLYRIIFDDWYSQEEAMAFEDLNISSDYIDNSEYIIKDKFSLTYITESLNYKKCKKLFSKFKSKNKKIFTSYLINLIEGPILKKIFKMYPSGRIIGDIQNYLIKEDEINDTNATITKIINVLHTKAENIDLIELNSISEISLTHFMETINPYHTLAAFGYMGYSMDIHDLVFQTHFYTQAKSKKKRLKAFEKYFFDPIELYLLALICHFPFKTPSPNIHLKKIDINPLHYSIINDENISAKSEYNNYLKLIKKLLRFKKTKTVKQNNKDRIKRKGK
jgi:hypothetical protein